MRIPLLTSVIFATAVLLPAQEKDVTILPVPGPTYSNEVKQYLGLSDAQVQSLETILKARNDAQQNHYNQINEKNRALYQLLESGTGSASQIGQLMLDIRTIEKQFPTLEAPFRNQAVNVLTADQKTKLAKLNEALLLQNTAWQATSLLLLEYPRQIGTPMPMPMPVEAGGGIGSSSGAVMRQAVPMIVRR